jgi:hypothetical protein
MIGAPLRFLQDDGSSFTVEKTLREKSTGMNGFNEFYDIFIPPSMVCGYIY